MKKSLFYLTGQSALGRMRIEWIKQIGKVIMLIKLNEQIDYLSLQFTDGDANGDGNYWTD
jgi:hypothetical protein